MEEHCERSLEYVVSVGVKLPFSIRLRIALVASAWNLARGWIKEGSGRDCPKVVYGGW